MHEIKFRAWDGEKMDYDPVCCTDGPEITKLNSNIQSMCEEWHRPKYLALMQYTGLKDKNGKEIYEGDILRYQKETTQKNKIKGYVVFDKSAFRVKHTLPGFKECVDLWNMYKSVIVTGNIHENPELLK